MDREEHIRLRQEAIAAKKARREKQLAIESRQANRKNARWIPHPEGVCSDGMGRYFHEGKQLIPPGKLIGHCIEGWLVCDG